MATFNVKFEKDFNIGDKDIELIKNEVAKGKDFDEVFYEVTAGYDDTTFYNRNLFRDQVKEYIETIPRTDTYSLSLTIDNLTKDMAENLKKVVEGKGRITFGSLGVSNIEVVNKEN